ncbi:hypothetical protein KSP35_08150 [Aquihabitans sp. G128]|uniref:hypothetical protein n=1 Tax=Aquihabitans sp. G128 TaxID=2849779 RepID=UPI001C21AAB8|nr:hypothetical protein [Aquihabitans sp. G128]QXC62749.1 hypothetical protein KSP35_08150 [Aquihabitans sp. G128]
MTDDELLRSLGEAVSPTVPAVDAARVDAIRALATGAAAVAPLRPSRRSLLRLGGAAAAGIAAGATGMFLLDGDDAPAGPPTEAAVLKTATGVQADAKMIAHTWGLEVLLDVSGLDPGAAYEMTFVATDGRRVGAGGFVGTDALMRCRNNGPLLRADVASFVVVADDGTEVVRAELA